MTSRILSQKTIHASRYLKCKETTLALSNKKKLQYADVYRKPIAGVFPVTDDGFIYLIPRLGILLTHRLWKEGKL